MILVLDDKLKWFSIVSQVVVYFVSVIGHFHQFYDGVLNRHFKMGSTVKF